MTTEHDEGFCEGRDATIAFIDSMSYVVKTPVIVTTLRELVIELRQAETLKPIPRSAEHTAEGE